MVIVSGILSARGCRDAVGIASLQQLSPGRVRIILEKPLSKGSAKWLAIPLGMTSSVTIHFEEESDLTKIFETRIAGTAGDTPQEFQIRAIKV